ncbi:MAG: DNA-binding response regulator [Bacteroidetes bacterium GWC2_33_15]|nr:MAG: DNA-binding response regulator [Bacteroidetes bacterium GWA2_33_15]OFX49935.1 MAG: DNA-binding response regulator [Bacteroidetes bacterium GWC2_33_15]OFX64216.1 MAG: DNA-binding response regulator [Bacteroidetes bacterium GWB2_32_14]OFX69629.1 MAG: DNA-binding response regulator [Bacteroidetes bacterium GWD2_33_33]HAN19513.1 DNA-binding response regulator [Bacteroidales bacterium]
MRVLIVEDEKGLATEIKEFLEKEEYNCDLAITGNEASELIAVNPYDFILLDIGLPDYNGLDLIKEAKEYNSEAYFIIITARGELEDKIKGFDLGADDYLAKPFSLLELLSRVQAITRRKFGQQSSIIHFGNFSLDTIKKYLEYEGQPVDLTKKEYKLLSYLILNKNRVLDRLQLTEHIWGEFYEDDYDSNYIDVHIKNIRKKLAEYDENNWIKTIRGIGYKFEI